MLLLIAAAAALPGALVTSGLLTFVGSRAADVYERRRLARMFAAAQRRAAVLGALGSQGAECVLDSRLAAAGVDSDPFVRVEVGGVLWVATQAQAEALAAHMDSEDTAVLEDLVLKMVLQTQRHAAAQA